MRKTLNLNLPYNPFFLGVVVEPQKGVVGGEAPCHATCVNNGFFQDAKVKRRIVAFQQAYSDRLVILRLAEKSS